MNVWLITDQNKNLEFIFLCTVKASCVHCKQGLCWIMTNFKVYSWHLTRASSIFKHQASCWEPPIVPARSPRSSCLYFHAEHKRAEKNVKHFMTEDFNSKLTQLQIRALLQRWVILGWKPVKQHLSATEALMGKLDNKQWAEEAKSTGSYVGQRTCKNEFTYWAGQ